jgi:hypothetical protein
MEDAMAKKTTLDPKLQAWVRARKRHHLSHAHVQMARELGMNPAKLGKLDNHDQEPWKAPLPIFIEDLYEKRFGRSRPETVRSVEELARERERKKAARRQAKAERRAALAGTAKAGRGLQPFETRRRVDQTAPCLWGDGGGTFPLWDKGL